MNVPEIETFINELNPVLTNLIQLREDLNAADRLWPVLDATAKTAIHNIATTRFEEYQTALAAIVIP